MEAKSICIWCGKAYIYPHTFKAGFCSEKCWSEQRSSAVSNPASVRELSAAEESLRLLKLQAREAELERLREAFYSRECPQCAEFVKRKAKICKECNFPFADWESQRAELQNWEERAAAFGLYPWQCQEIERKEYLQTPEGLAEQARLEEELKLREQAPVEAANISVAETMKRKESTIKLERFWKLALQLKRALVFTSHKQWNWSIKTIGVTFLAVLGLLLLMFADLEARFNQPTISQSKIADWGEKSTVKQQPIVEEKVEPIMASSLSVTELNEINSEMHQDSGIVVSEPEIVESPEPVAGVVGGVLGGQLGGVNIVHWSEVKIKRKVIPKIPQAAKALGINEETCIVRFTIDTRGKPESVSIEKCSKPLHTSIEVAAKKWRFYPVKSESGRKTKVTFLQPITVPN